MEQSRAQKKVKTHKPKPTTNLAESMNKVRLNDQVEEVDSTE